MGEIVLRPSFVHVFGFGSWMWIVFHISIALCFSLKCCDDLFVVRSCVNVRKMGSNVVLETMEIVCFG